MPALSFSPPELIRRKREGGSFAPAQLDAVAAGLAQGGFSDEQVGAFAMACYLKGLTLTERAEFARALADSGQRLDWRSGWRRRLKLDRPIVDKHSTGGVGDKVSLILAPLAAACGLAVPMISGRGLGHTGGTLDKMAAIPGYCVAPSAERFARTVRLTGCAIIGQTDDMAPADRRLYAVRDVTATVDSIPLITASILSKKLAAGLDALVMDIKTGSGALLPTEKGTDALASSLIKSGRRLGLKTTALLTPMDQVLGRTAGNALEVLEAIAFLRGDDLENGVTGTRDPRLLAVTLALAGEMLRVGGIAADAEAGAALALAALEDGRAAEIFARMTASLGAPGDLIERPAARLPVAAVTRPVFPTQAGVVQQIDVRAVGMAVVSLGGGRMRADQAIDPSVGLAAVAGLGEAVGPDQPLALVHARDAISADRAAVMVRAAFKLGATGPTPGAVLIRKA